MAQFEFQGRDLEEAIAQAAQALSLPPEKVKFSVISMGGKGFLGLGRSKARIKVDPDDPVLNTEDEAGPPAPAERPVVNTAEAAPAEAPAAPEAEKKRGRRERSDRDKPAPAQRQENKSRRNEPEKKDEEPLPELVWDHVPPPLTRPGPNESEEPADQPAALAAEVAREIISRMGFEAEIAARRIGSRIILTLESRDNAILIGGRGATLEALQLLTGKIVSRRLKEGGSETVRVVVDAADYRFRRQESLLENLKTLAEQARRSRRPQTMSGLSSADRRLVQMALRPYKDLAAAHSPAGRDALVISAQPQPSRPRPRRRSNGGHHK